MNHTAVLVLASNGILVNDAGHRVGAIIFPLVQLRLHIPAPVVRAVSAVSQVARQAWYVAFGPGWGEDLKLMWGAVVEPLGGVYV